MSEAELRAKCFGFGCDAPALHRQLDAANAEIERLDALEAENRELRELNAVNESGCNLALARLEVSAKVCKELTGVNERLRAELATARNDALEEAARLATPYWCAQGTCSEHPNQVGLRIAWAIRALKREGGGNG